jgi:hypothetical protein
MSNPTFCMNCTVEAEAKVVAEQQAVLEAHLK